MYLGLVMLQSVGEQMWSDAVNAAHKLNDAAAGYHAWLWAQQHHSGWKHQDPLCYLFLAQAIAAFHDQPMEG